MTFTYETMITLHPIDIRKDKKNFIVEDKATGEFYEMTSVCVDAIHMINQKYRLDEIERVLKERYSEEDVDMLEFVQQLVKLQLVQEIDGEEVAYVKQKREPGFQWISPKVGQFFFNKYMNLGYAILFLLNAALFIAHPMLFPHYKDLFVFDVMTLNIVIWLVVTFLLVLFHELGHVLAMRVYDLTTKVEVGHRLVFVVLETDMSTAWRLSPSNRNILYLAGLSFDMVILFAALVAQILFVRESPIFLGVMGVVVFNVVLRVIYQCCIYMKTDLYFVFENITGCYNLMENGRRYVRKCLGFRSQGVQDEVFEGEEHIVKWYGVCYVVGVIITLSLVIIYYIPQLIYMFSQTIPNLGKSATDFRFWDAVLLVIQTCIMVGLLLYSWMKNDR